MNDYIRRAEHALRTGQPNLAVLYMRRGLSESPEGRQWLAWYDLRAAAIALYNAVGGIVQTVLDAFGGGQPTQQDFALIPEADIPAPDFTNGGKGWTL